MQPVARCLLPKGVLILTGPARCGKTVRLLEAYRVALRQFEPGETLWLAPTSRSASAVRGRLVGADLAGALSPGVMTFDNFASTLLRGAAEPVRPLGGGAKRQILSRLISEAHQQGELSHFGSIAHSPGFLELLADFISDLKRHEVWPESYAAACRSGTAGRKDRELALLYQRYQDALNRGRLYDAEGRFWWARTLLVEEGSALSTPRFVVADGFTDFTHTQHEILEVLAARSAALLVSLPLEAEAGREDLFRKTRETLATFCQRHAGLQVESLPRLAEPGWSAGRHIEQQLFRNPREQTPAAKTTGVQIAGVAGQAGELRWLARTIKQLLLEGDAERGGARVRPGEIGVVLRNGQTLGPHISEVFAEYGLPLALEAAPSLDRIPALAAMLGVLELEVADWPIAQLLAVAGNSFFRPNWSAWREGRGALDLDYVVRELQIPAGRKKLREAIATWAGLPLPDELDGDTDMAAVVARHRWVERCRRARGALGVVDELVAALARLPATATGADWSVALRQLAVDLNFEQSLDQFGQPQDRLAWERLLAALAAENQLAAQLEQAPQEFDAAQVLALLHDICRWERLPGGGSEAGRIRVLSAPSVRGLEIPYLFVAGLSESSFPQHRSPQFHGVGEIEALRSQGLRFDPHLERGEDEMLLFYETVTRATRRLYLSYPALDDSAQRLLPSPYVLEVESACGAGSVERVEFNPLEAALPPGPAWGPQELRAKGVADALAGEPRLLGAVLRRNDALAQQLRAGWNANISRGDRDRFGPFEGLLAGDVVKSVFAERFAATHCWTASDLEQYASCPFRFLLSRVLRIVPLMELELDIDAAERGQLLHETLARVYRDSTLSEGDLAVRDPAQFQSAFARTLETVLDENAATSPLAPAWRTINRQVLLRWGENYLRQATDYAEGPAAGHAFRPAHFEVAFGISGEGVQKPSTAAALELQQGDETLLLRGRIDRIDIAETAGQTLLNIVDYKSGAGPQRKPKDVEPTRLQADLYAMAAADLLFADRQAAAHGSGYWYLRNQGYVAEFSQAALGDADAYQARRRRVLEIVFELAAAARRGEFPVYSADEDCTGRCAFNRACRVNQVRNLEKVWPAPPAGN